MYARTASGEDGLVPSRSRSVSRMSSTSAADIVEASFVTVPINQNDGGKWEFRFENDPEKVEEKRSLEIFRQIAVCSQLTTDKLDIDEDVPKPANACVKGLLDLCTLINEQYDDKSTPKPEKVPIWKKHVDLISPGICAAMFPSRMFFTHVTQASALHSCSGAGRGMKHSTSACLGECRRCFTTRP